MTPGTGFASSAQNPSAPFSGTGSTFAPATTGTLQTPVARDASDGLPERLFDSRAGFKVRFANIAMHLSKDWRERLSEAEKST